MVVLVERPAKLIIDYLLLTIDNQLLKRKAQHKIRKLIREIRYDGVGINKNNSFG